MVLGLEMRNRNDIIKKINDFLKSERFETSDIYDQGSFDIVARRDFLILILKAFVNIDSVNKANIGEMKQLSNIFLASPIIVGERSRSGRLEDGVIYERYDIPAINFVTFSNMILNKEYPQVMANRGGYFLKIDSNLLKQYREEYSLSLKDLADIAHVSRATMYKYENGLVNVNIETAMLLEEALNTQITLDIDLLKPWDEKSGGVSYSSVDESTEILSKLGYGVFSTVKSPFDAAAKMDNDESAPLLANIEKNRTSKTLNKMAITLKDLSLITSSDTVFIVNNEKFNNSIGEIPVVKSWELKEFEHSSELLKLIKERKE